MWLTLWNRLISNKSFRFEKIGSKSKNNIYLYRCIVFLCVFFYVVHLYFILFFLCVFYFLFFSFIKSCVFSYDRLINYLFKCVSSKCMKNGKEERFDEQSKRKTTTERRNRKKIKEMRRRRLKTKLLSFTHSFIRFSLDPCNSCIKNASWKHTISEIKT